MQDREIIGMLKKADGTIVLAKVRELRNGHYQFQGDLEPFEKTNHKDLWRQRGLPLVLRICGQGEE